MSAEISCPDADRLAAYSRGELSEADAIEIRAHLEQCPSCGSKRNALGGQHEEAAPDPAAGEPPRELGEYRILEKLGEGGMGAVYRAVHTRLDKIVALKILPTRRGRDDEVVARFDREMKAIGRLNHPNIVQASDAREIGGTRFLVMEYIDGADFARIVNACGRLSLADACEAIRQAALGLQAAHELDLVHRDVKPSNLMLTLQGQVKVLDLGLARFHSDSGGNDLTLSGQIMGTADYMAPEQVSDCHHVDIRADIYSLGCSLYKLLTGQAPFDDPQSAGPMARMAARMVKAAPPIRQIRHDVPRRLAAVVERMLAKEPASRFDTPQAVADALLPFAAGADLAGLARRVRTDAAPTPIAASETGDDRMFAAVRREMQEQQAPAASSRPSRSRRLAVAVVVAGIAALGLGIGWRYFFPAKHVNSAAASLPLSRPPLGNQPPLSPSSTKPRGNEPPVAKTPRRAAVPLDEAPARKYQQAWAKRHGVPVDLTNSIGMKLRLAPPGEFRHGSCCGDGQEPSRGQHPRRPA